jgi:hypothetical protein
MICSSVNRLGFMSIVSQVMDPFLCEIEGLSSFLIVEYRRISMFLGRDGYQMSHGELMGCGRQRVCKCRASGRGSASARHARPPDGLDPSRDCAVSGRTTL